MLLTIAVILGFGAIRISTGAITAGTLIAMIFMLFNLRNLSLIYQLWLQIIKRL